ncbi:hypothetical protein [Corallococcus interemptor]|uniref:hypothetical protein n=1 Tax=Corallococcus interemptor TaxID=2316720 RepID=UPI001ABF3FD5|nr:hypothetical protein [Corallococcus interemptor]
MRFGRGALLMALALGACSRPGAGTEASDAGATGLPGRQSPLALPSCEELLPADLRDLTLNGFTMKEDRACPTCGPVCSLRPAAQADVSVSVAYDCQPSYANADVRALLAPTLNAGGEEVPALGKAAARRNPVQGMTQVVTWDDDTPCVVIVTWLGDDPDRALDVARLAVTSHHGVVEADAGTEPPADAGDSLLLDAPLEPLDSLTTPRAGTTATLSAPSGTRAVTPPPVVPSPRPVVPAPQRPVQKPAPTAPAPVTQKPPAATPPATVPAATPPAPETPKPSTPAPPPATPSQSEPAAPASGSDGQ